jgi:hypothetical protein
MQGACSAGGLQCRVLAVQVACSAGCLQSKWLGTEMMWKVRGIKSNDDGIDNFIFSD